MRPELTRAPLPLVIGGKRCSQHLCAAFGSRPLLPVGKPELPINRASVHDAQAVLVVPPRHYGKDRLSSIRHDDVHEKTLAAGGDVVVVE